MHIIFLLYSSNFFPYIYYYCAHSFCKAVSPYNTYQMQMNGSVIVFFQFKYFLLSHRIANFFDCPRLRGDLKTSLPK